MLNAGGKLDLTTDAVKVVAKRLERSHEDGGSPKAAIMAGLRFDNEPRYCFTNKSIVGSDEPPHWVNLRNPMKVISGSQGCGKTRLLKIWTQLAAEKGFSSLSVSAEMPRRWADEDLFVIDGPTTVAGSPRVAEEVRRSLRKGDVPHLCVVIANPVVHRELNRQFVRQVLRDVYENGHDDVFVTVDDFEWGEDTDLLSWIAQASETRTFQFATTTRRSTDFSMKDFSKLPSELRMYSDSSADRMHAGFNRQDLKIGQFMLNGFLDAVYDTPEELGDPRKSRLGDAAMRAVGRLEAELLKGNVHTHTDRLNAVAKACGFRSWHAVQGRRPKSVF